MFFYGAFKICCDFGTASWKTCAISSEFWDSDTVAITSSGEVFFTGHQVIYPFVKGVLPPLEPCFYCLLSLLGALQLCCNCQHWVLSYWVNLLLVLVDAVKLNTCFLPPPKFGNVLEETRIFQMLSLEIHMCCVYALEYFRCSLFFVGRIFRIVNPTYRVCPEFRAWPKMATALDY